MIDPEELDLVAALISLLSLVISGVFLAANQPSRSAWISLIVGGIFVTLVELIGIYLRLYSE